MIDQRSEKIVNIPFTIRSNGFDTGEIIIHEKRVLSFISEHNTFPGHFTLYNWHELCKVAKVYFLKESDIKESIVGIGLYGKRLMVQIHSKSYPSYIQVSTPCPKWLLEKYTEEETTGHICSSQTTSFDSST